MTDQISIPAPPGEEDWTSYPGNGKNKYVAVAFWCVAGAFVLIVVAGLMLFFYFDYGYTTTVVEGSRDVHVAAAFIFSIGAVLLLTAAGAWFWRQLKEHINRRLKAKYLAIVLSCVITAFVLIVVADILLFFNFVNEYYIRIYYSLHHIYTIRVRKAKYLAATFTGVNCAILLVVLADALLYLDWHQNQIYAGSGSKTKYAAPIVSCAVGAFSLIFLEHALLFPDWQKTITWEGSFATYIAPPISCAVAALLLLVMAGALFWIRKHKKHIDTRLMAQYVAAAVSLAVGAFLIIAVAGLLFWARQHNDQLTNNGAASASKVESHESSFENGFSGDCRLFYLSELKTITNNFSENNKLGEGGFGPVYKGVLRDGKQIAVKRLAGWSKQGYIEFKNEVDLLAKLKHKNLVKLLGYCMEQNEKMLCYEYLPSGSLDWILFATDEIKKEMLNWETRYKIIQGISCGLQYLHIDSGSKIIHRDLKPSNILLDEHMNPKISDFGLARLYENDQTHKETSIIAGTYGYMAPEYALHGMYSEKLDVYSFGIMVLEIVTGRKSSSFCNNQLATNLISYAWHHWEKGELDELKDPAIDDVRLDQLSKCIHIALLCVQESPMNRPNMDVVNYMLRNIESIAIPAIRRSRSGPKFLLSQANMSSNSSTSNGTRSGQASSSYAFGTKSTQDTNKTHMLPR